MLAIRVVVCMISVGIVMVGARTACGQAYPSKPIRIVTTGVGGGNDYGARLISPGLSTGLGQPVIVENRGGAGFAPGEIVARAAPDGYTLDFAASTHFLQPLLQKAPYDAVKDFSFITMITRSPQILVVHPSVPATSVKELIAFAKANPGTLNFLSTGAGSTNHLAGELFNVMAGVKMVHIPYANAGTAITDLLSGRVQIRFGSGAGVTQFVKVGKLRALAVTSLQPSELYPGLPTVANSGLPGYEMTSLLSMLAPARTPAVIMNRLNQEIVRVISTPDVKDKFFDAGAEIVGSSPAEFAAYVRSYTTLWAKVVKDADIRAD